MGVINFLRKKLTGMVFSTSRPWIWLLPRTLYDYSRDVGDGLRSSVLVAVLFWIMRRFAEAKMVVIRDEEMERDHDLLKLFHRPNPFYSGRSLRMAAALSYNLDGNAYLVKIRNNQLKPKQLWYVPHWLIEPHWPESGNEFIDYYSYKPEGREIKIDPEDIIHVRFGLDPNNVRKGLAPMKSLVREIFTDDEAANFTASLLRNMGVPGLMIAPGDDSMALPDDKEEIKDFFREKFGRDRRGEPLVMGGKTDIKQFGYNPQELDLSRIRNIPEERVTAVLGVHAAVVGFGTGLEQTKVGATMKELRESAYEDCIIPMQNVFAEELDIQLMPDLEERPDDINVGFDLSDVRVLQEDENQKATRLDVMVRGGWLTVADAQRQMGMEADDSQEIYLRAFNLIPVPKGEVGPTLPVVEGGEGGNGKSKLIEQVKVFLPTTAKADSWQVALRNQLLKDWFHLADIWSRELKKVFKKLGEQAAEVWNQLVEERDIQLNAAKPQTKEVDIDEIYAQLIAEQIDTGILTYGPHFLRVAKQTVETITAITGLAVNLSEPAEMRILAGAGTKRGLIDLAAQNKNAIFKALTEARSLGEGPPQVAQRIRDMVSAGPWSSSEVRSMVIARTETKFAQNISSIEAYKTSPDITGIRVIDAQLGPTDEFCEQINGAIVTIAEAEILAVEEHPNGTRSFAPVVGG